MPAQTCIEVDDSTWTVCLLTVAADVDLDNPRSVVVSQSRNTTWAIPVGNPGMPPAAGSAVVEACTCLLSKRC